LPFASYAAATPFLPVINKLGTETLSRMVESIRLYREIPDARLIVSGGIVRQKDGPIANLMAEFTTTMGYPGKTSSLRADRPQPLKIFWK